MGLYDHGLIAGNGACATAHPLPACNTTPAPTRKTLRGVCFAPPLKFLCERNALAEGVPFIVCERKTPGLPFAAPEW
jgi:hypothetical protein